MEKSHTSATLCPPTSPELEPHAFLLFARSAQSPLLLPKCWFQPSFSSGLLCSGSLPQRGRVAWTSPRSWDFNLEFHHLLPQPGVKRPLFCSKLNSQSIFLLFLPISYYKTFKHAAKSQELYFAIHLPPRGHNEHFAMFALSPYRFHLSVFLSILHHAFKFILNSIFFACQNKLSPLEAFPQKPLN